MTDYMYGSQEKVVINNSLIDNNSHQLCHSDIGGHVLVEVFFQRNINSCKAFPQERHPDESTRLPTRQPGWEKDRTKKAGTTFGQVGNFAFLCFMVLETSSKMESRTTKSRIVHQDITRKALRLFESVVTVETKSICSRLLHATWISTGRISWLRCLWWLCVAWALTEPPLKLSLFKIQDAEFKWV